MLRPMSGASLPVVVTCARGTEKALKFELKAAGMEGLKSLPGAVAAQAGPDAIAAANVFSRIGGRVLVTLEVVQAASEDELYEALLDFRFEDHLARGATFAVQTNLKDAPATHSLHISRRVKDAVVDRFRRLGRERPDTDPKRPDVRFGLHWENTTATLSLDTTGTSLHKRGYRPPGGEAPMKETLAAAILAMGHADVRRPFLDPCCGTGTLAIEQAWRSLRRAPGLKRRFPMDRWARDVFDLRPGLARARERAHDELRQKLEAPVRLSDWHPDAVALARSAVEAAGLSAHLEVEQVDARRASLEGERLVVCTNLPFGERLGKSKTLQLDGFYRTLGERLGELPGARILLFTTHPYAERLLNLGRPLRWPLYSGPLKAMLRRWDLEGEAAPEDPGDDDLAS